MAALPRDLVAYRLSDGSIWIWGRDRLTWQVITGLSSGDGALAALPHNRLAYSDGSVIRIRQSGIGDIHTLEDGCEDVLALAALPDGRLASCSCDCVIRLWGPSSGALTRKLFGHEGWINALTTLRDGRLASGSSDNTVRLWDIKAGAETARLDGNGNGVTSLAVLNDGRIAAGSWDATVRLWDPVARVLMARLEGHRNSVYALVSLPDGRVASGSSDKTIRVWDPDTSAEIERLGHAGVVNTFGVLRNGELVSGSDDMTIRLWGEAQLDCARHLPRVRTH